MPEIERTKVREREPEQRNSYERSVKLLMDLRERNLKGKIVLKYEDHPWEQSRHSRAKYFICRAADTGSALKDWEVFIHDIRVHSGKHRHQGGLVIYVLEGEGYTEVDGQKVEWEAGDLLLLPMKVDGVVHQHFNKHPGHSCKWMAFIYKPYGDEIGYYIEHKENSFEYK